MKKILLTFIITFSAIINLYAQTTEEEFNYCTKGYGQQVENGVDPIKKGYKVEDIPVKYERKGRKYSFKKLIKVGTGLRAIIIIVQVRENIQYGCIPDPKTESILWENAMNDINRKVGFDNIGELASALVRLTNYLAYK